MAAKRTRITTRLTPDELRVFKRVERFVRGWCGKVSRAEVLRFLVRNWEDPDGR